MEVSSLNIAFYRWLEPFLDTIKTKGFTVSPDTHILLLKILAGKSEEISDPETLYDFISPVIAKTGEQRKELREEFDKYYFQSANSFTAVASAAKKKRNVGIAGKKWPFYLFLSLLALVGLFFIYHRLRSKPHPVYPKYQVNFTNISKPVVFDAGIAFKTIADTSLASYKWDFGDGNTDSSNSPVVSHKYLQPGSYKTSLAIIDKEDDEKLSIESPLIIQEINLCKPQIFLESDAGIELPLNAAARFYPVYDSLFSGGQSNTWLVNGSVVAHNQPALEWKFDSAGLQVVSYIDSGYSSTASCPISQADKPIYVRPPTNITAEIIQSGDPIEPPVKMNNTFLLIAGLLITTGMLVYLWNLSKYNAQKRKRKMKPEDVLSTFTGNKPPYQIPFKNYEDIIDDEPYISRLARNLKRRMPDESSFINIPVTINETIKADGLIMPHYSFKTRPVEYLVLIDRTKANNQQVKLFEYLLRRFIKTDLFIEIFYYDGLPDKCVNDKYPNGIPLSRLFDLYSTNVLIVFSDGNSFIKKSYPALEDAIASIVKKWEHRVLVTPKPYKDWAYKEEILQRAFEVLPADLEGQMLLFAREEGLDDNLQEYGLKLKQGYSVKNYDFDDVDDIKAYLNDPFLFQWICAIAIYPALHWQVILAIGDALQHENYPAQTINYTCLLKLVRISWMAEGSMPDDTRLELLKALEPANELLARRTMISVLNEAATKVSDNSFVYEQLEMQRITDKFMLYAQDPDDPEHKAYERAYHQFKMLWNSDNVPDAPLSEYLKKEEGGNWSTLIGNRNLSSAPAESAAINDYLNEKIDVQQRRRVVWMRAALISALFIVAMLLSLYIFKSQVQSTAIDKALQLTEVDSNYLVPVSFGYIGNDCFSNIKAGEDSAEFVLAMGDQWAMSVDANDTAKSAEVPYRYFALNDARLVVNSNDIQFALDSNITIEGNSIRVQYVGCPVICNNWQALVNYAVPEQFRGVWYSAGLLNGTVDSYAPLIMKAYTVNDEENVEAQACASNRNMMRLITKTKDGRFKSYIVNTRTDEDKIGLNDAGQAFNSKTDAERQSSNVQMMASYINIEKTSWQPGTNASITDTLKGTWKNDDTELKLYGNAVTYNGNAGVIAGVRLKNITGRKLYSFLFVSNMNSKAGADSALFYAIPISATRMMISIPSATESTDTITGNVNMQQNFYAITRTDSVVSNFKNASLPYSLNEIWSSGNRMININVAKGSIYYSIDAGNSYTTYTMIQTGKDDKGTYRIVSKQNNQYLYFFIKNISSSSFDISVCQPVAIQIAQSNSNAMVCDEYRSMRLYYPASSNSIYLPNNSRSLAGVEKKKLESYLQQIKSGNYKFTAYVNREFLINYDVNTVAKMAGGYLDPKNGSVLYSLRPKSTPFSRSYLQIAATAINGRSNEINQQKLPDDNYNNPPSANEFNVNSTPPRKYRYQSPSQLQVMLQQVVEGKIKEDEFENLLCDGIKTEVEVNGVRTTFSSLYQSLFRSSRKIENVSYERVYRYSDGSRCIKKLIVRHVSAAKAY